jgi:signal peptidase I
MMISYTLTNTFFQTVPIEGTSMLDTFYDEDIVIIYKLGNYKRGDLIIFISPDTYGNPVNELEYYVKRIIGLPGDTVDVQYNSDLGEWQTRVNGELIDEPYVLPENEGGVSCKTTVPEGRFFFMGDNRKVSKDSRRGELGTLSREAIKGRVIVRYYIGDDRSGKFEFDIDFIKRGE